ncbi:MAG: hypothetical protein LUM44_13040 [Pyrinomonadaceae bacterium]|nr:hypothetical protein [Pyrinomonadaceae bacterium]
MMNNNNHQNSNCAFAADIVSYIYGEIGEKEKSAFESHLSNCETCPEELADFMDIRFSVNDWKQTEFTPLSTPVIEIPYEKEQVREIAADSGSWWSNLRQIFTLSPAWMTATTAVAALVICAGLFFAFYKYSSSVEVAEVGNKPQNKPTVSPTSEISSSENDEKIAVSVENSNSSDKIAEPPKVVNPSPKIINESGYEPSVVKVAERKLKTVTQNPVNRTTNNTVNNSNKQPIRKNSPAKNQPLPKLNNFDEDEDDSLRLAELFEDIETLE